MSWANSLCSCMFTGSCRNGCWQGRAEQTPSSSQPFKQVWARQMQPPSVVGRARGPALSGQPQLGSQALASSGLLPSWLSCLLWLIQKYTSTLVKHLLNFFAWLRCDLLHLVNFMWCISWPVASLFGLLFNFIKEWLYLLWIAISPDSLNLVNIHSNLRQHPISVSRELKISSL